ncbi:MAG TPA: RNA-binding protein, partial [Planctomycetaceae bacterium]|nr:RNA-binding protein [Planctomycetaceae bacterium]
MSKNIFVGSLAWGTTSEGLEQAFAQYGVVTSAKVVSDRETGRSKGFGFVEMETGGDEAIRALNGSDLDGRQIVVNEARPRESGGGGGGGGGGRGGDGGGGGGGRGGGGGGGYGGGGG